ncbi:MFS transporter, partial [Streptomyces sp. NPDC127051]|uniref:MFS transporter n=1 Tax=Streptomyces sp. NPDC127051 TaxID=3347119 RepID=UPI003655CCFF
MIFSAYSLTLLVALLTVGALSDHLGRRPVLVGALVLEAVSMLVLASADGADPLIAARILQGAATGAATSAAGAALLDLADPRRAGRSALTNSLAPVAGMAAGVLIATLLVRFAPAPTATAYGLLAALFAAQAIAVTFIPETARPRAGGLRSLRPQLAVPPTARRALLAAGTGVVAVWGLGGFYSSLGPALVRLVAPGAPYALGGMVFFTVSAAAALTVWTLRRTAPFAAATGGAVVVIPSMALSLLASSLTTTVFSQRSMRWFGASLRRATPKGQNLHHPCSTASRTRPTSTPLRVQRALSPFLIAASSGLGEEALAGEASEAAAR